MRAALRNGIVFLHTFRLRLGPRMLKKLEALANVAIMVVAGLASAVLIKTYLLPQPAVRQIPQVVVGDKSAIEGVDWKANRRTLVLALQTTCRFCSESASLYRRLTDVLPKAGVHMIAVLPQAKTESVRYLRSLDVNVTDVRQESFVTLKIPGTPTLMLVDEVGVVRNVWVGKLSPQRENDLVTVLLAVRGKS